VSVALVTQHEKAHAPYYMVICGPSGYNIFLHIWCDFDRASSL